MKKRELASFEWRERDGEGRETPWFCVLIVGCILEK